MYQLTGGPTHHHSISAVVVKSSGLGEMPASGASWAAEEEGAPASDERQIPENHISPPQVHAVTLPMTWRGG